MTWFDIAALVPLAAIACFEIRQEFGRSLLDALAALLALYFAARLVASITPHVHLMTYQAANSALVFLLLFGLFLTVGLVASRWMHSIYRVSVDRFDPLFGALFGVTVAVILGHAGISALWEYYNGTPPHFLAESRLGSELLNLHGLRAAADSFQQVVQAR